MLGPVDDGIPNGTLQGLLATAAHASTLGITVTDARVEAPGPTILYVNPAFEAMTGYRSEQVTGQSPRLLQGPATDRSVLARLRHDLVTSGYCAGEAVNYRSNGEPFIMAWQSRAIPGPDGAPSHYVATQSDVTAERRRDAQERRAAERLQAELLPTVDPRVGPLAVVTRYRAADSELTIGGDWYDAFELDDGTVSLVVGDVAGHGVLAAATMGRLRWSVRTLVGTGLPDSEVIGHLREIAITDELFATLALARYQPTPSRLHVTTVGHPPALVWNDDGVHELWRPNPLVGIAADHPDEVSTRFGLDDVLLLYTDGVLDGGRRDPRWLVSCLERFGSPRGRSLHSIADDVMALTDRAGTTDDAALLVARPVDT